MILECISGVKSTNGSAVRSLREKVCVCVCVCVFLPAVADRKPDFEPAELSPSDGTCATIGAAGKVFYSLRSTKSRRPY